MLFPYGTDAPLYYRPFATVAIIAINVAMFLMTGMGDYDAHRWLILEFDKINPLQWITAAFMHLSWIHLVGNMIYLWCFGLVVEGKLGWRRFSLLYLGLALVTGAIGQIPMFFMSGFDGSPYYCGALGASGVIFALIAIAMVWAPENEMSCLFIWSFFFIRTIDIPIFGLAAFYIAIEFFQVWMSDFSMSTPMLHSIGIAAGFPFAVIMLKNQWVDCEGYDWFSRHTDLTARMTSWSPLAWIGGLLFGTPARRRAQLELSMHRDASAQDALALIRQDPDRFNPQPSRSPSFPMTQAPVSVTPISDDSGAAAAGIGQSLPNARANQPVRSRLVASKEKSGRARTLVNPPTVWSLQFDQADVRGSKEAVLCRWSNNLARRLAVQSAWALLQSAVAPWSASGKHRTARVVVGAGKPACRSSGSAVGDHLLATSTRRRFGQTLLDADQ